MSRPENTATEGLEALRALSEDLPPVCEIADLAVALRWREAADGPCEGAGEWLLIGEDAPSPLCTKHAQMLADRCQAFLDAYGMRLVRS